MKKPRTIVAASLVVAALGVVAGPAAADVADAAGWLATQQQPDGGFEVAGFAGFETADAILALAESAQSDAPWNADLARAAVSGVINSDGRTPYDGIDDEAEAGPTAGAAAKIVAMVAGPGGWAAGLSPVAFDPSGDGGAVDLVAVIGAGFDPDTASYGTFGDTLLAVLAQRQLCVDTPDGVVASIIAASAPSGGWNFAGDASEDTFDPDITGRTLQALAAKGVGSDDPAVASGLKRLAVEHDTATGAWISFGEANPNSTAMAMLGLAAHGIDTSTSDWRDGLAPERVGEPYIDPAAYLLSRQLPAGQVASPSDAFGINTFATSQSVQALSRVWDWASAPACPDLSSPAATTTTLPPTTTGPTQVGDVQRLAVVKGSTQARTTTAAPATTTLANTGSSSWWMVGLGSLLLLTGLALTRAGRWAGETAGERRR